MRRSWRLSLAWPRRAMVLRSFGRVDVGRHVGHVEHQPLGAEREPRHHRLDDPTVDRGDVLGRDGIHGVPEAAVVQRGGRHLDHAIAGRARPPPLEGELRARVHHAVGHHELDVGADRHRGVVATRPEHLVDDLAHPQPTQHRERGGQGPKVEVPTAFGQHLGAVERGLDVGGSAQIALRHDAGLATDPGRFSEVVVGVPLDLLGDDRSHTLGNTPSAARSRAPRGHKRAGRANFWKKSPQPRSRASGNSPETPARSPTRSDRRPRSGSCRRRTASPTRTGRRFRAP